jgi:hemerythrin-like domain-containing protein
MSTAKATVTATIRSEHRSLAAVIHGVKTLCEDAHSSRSEPDFALLWRMVYYVEAFTDAVHHPHEDRYLFARVRDRSPAAVPVLEELERQHHDGPARLNDIRIALGHYEAGVSGASAALVAAVGKFADFYWRHMAMEERELLSLAEAALSDADWEWVAEGFKGHADPLHESATSDHFWKLLQEIVRRAPAPLGYGGPR